MTDPFQPFYLSAIDKSPTMMSLQHLQEENLAFMMTHRQGYMPIPEYRMSYRQPPVQALAADVFPPQYRRQKTFVHNCSAPRKS